MISETYTRQGKRGISTLFLSQSYYSSPKNIRQNINYCIILKLGGSRDVNAIFFECTVGISKEELLYMYNDATKEKFNCLVINLEKSGDERYRKNFLDYYTIE